MPIAISCGGCGRKLLADKPGQIVKCPQCGARLRVPEPVATTADVPREDSATDSTENLLETLGDQSADMGESERELDLGTTLNLSPDETQAPNAPRATFQDEAAAAKRKGSAAEKTSEKAPGKSDMVSRRTFLLVLSYASAVTIAFLLLLFRYLQPNMHALESLPDLEPPQKDGKIAVQLVPPESELPRGHVLRMNESQRFGNVEVTPVRVTRGPLEFVHFSGNADREHPATEPVLKLWLRFTNVSEDQEFSPLDRRLMLTRVPDGGDYRANTFVCSAEERTAGGEKYLVYDMPIASEWDLKDQQAGRVLKPGDSYLTYVPTDEAIDRLTGELVWRVHFRKGYHPESRRGVTTLVDVVFDSSSIEPEPATATSVAAAH